MTPTEPSRPVRPSRPIRIEWLDLFRGVAVLAMVETHVVNTFLASGLHDVPWFGWLNWFNGLIAPSFLFIAGYMQGMSWDQRPANFAIVLRKSKRLLGVAALGYALHFPFLALQQHHWTEALLIGTQVDVLPCLAVSLLGVLLVQLTADQLAEKWRRAVGLSMLVALGIVIVCLAPQSPEWNPSAIPVAAYLNSHTGSLFPLFPWAAFVVVGAIAGAFANRHMVWLLVAAAMAELAAHGFHNDTFSGLSPEFFCQRLAWVLTLAMLTQWLARIWRPRPILFAGRESLIMYAMHLILICRIMQSGVPCNSLNWAWTISAFLLVLLLTYAIAVTKVHWKSKTTI